MRLEVDVVIIILIVVERLATAFGINWDDVIVQVFRLARGT